MHSCGAPGTLRGLLPVLLPLHSTFFPMVQMPLPSPSFQARTPLSALAVTLLSLIKASPATRKPLPSPRRTVVPLIVAFPVACTWILFPSLASTMEP